MLTVTDVIDWDNPRPPMLISLCSEGKVKCWDALEVGMVTGCVGVVTEARRGHGHNINHCRQKCCGHSMRELSLPLLPMT